LERLKGDLMGYNDLTAPFEGGNDPWNDLEEEICDDTYNDLTIDTTTGVASGDEWNTEM
jgi:hypothetical protein